MSRIVLAAVISVAPTSAFAQDWSQACSAALAGGTWLGSSGPGGAILSDGDVSLDLSLAPDEVAAAWFEVSEGRSVVVEAVPVEAGDPVLALLAEDLSLIGEDDDGGVGLSSALTVNLGAGRYCVAARDFTGGAMTVSLMAGVSAPGDTAPEDVPPIVRADPATDDVEAHICPPERDAVELGVLAGSATQQTATVRDAPRYRFELAEPTSIELTAANEDADPYLFLYDASGDLLAENDDADGLDARIATGEVLPAGVYCAGLRALSDEGLPVTMTVAPVDPEAERQRLYAEGDAAPPLDGSHPVEDLGALDRRLRRELEIDATSRWFVFSVERFGAIIVDVVPEGRANPEVVIYDELGQYIDWDSNSGVGDASSAGIRVTPGRYVVGVRESDGALGRARMGVDLFVPAD